jgi:YjbE family integral membrane protein
MYDLWIFNWFVALGSILFANLMLSGDNLVIIALASRGLPHDQRRKATFGGCVGIIVMRVLLTFIAASILDIPYLQLGGGLLLLWIAVDLLSKTDNAVTCQEGASLLQAIRTIIIADLVISVDNVLTIAGIAQTVSDGKYSLIIAGLGTSIPMVAISSQFFINLVDRFIILVYAGAGVIGYAGAELMAQDKSINSMIAPYATGIEILLTIAVIVVGHWRRRQKLSYKDEMIS